MNRLYTTTVANKRKAFKFKRCKEFANLKRNKPKEFLRYFRSQNSNNNNINVPLKDLKNHFEQMFADINYDVNEDAEKFNTNHDFNGFYNIFGDIDSPITYEGYSICNATVIPISILFCIHIILMSIDGITCCLSVYTIS